MKEKEMRKAFLNSTIPGDWEVIEFGEFAEIIMGQSPEGNTYNQNGNGVALINGPTEFTEKYPVKVQWTTSPTKICKEGDILLCVRGSSTGRLNIANEEYCIGRGVAAIRAKKNSNHSFLEFQIENIVNKILSLTTGSTFPNIDSQSLKRIKVSLPPLPEQKAIAHILSLMDTAINKNNLLIAKKELQKKWLMQNLLTGKKRLLNEELGIINDEWKAIKLGDLIKLASGDTKPNVTEKDYSIEYRFPIYGGNGIMAYSNVFNNDEERIIIGRVGEYCGITRKITGKCWITDNALFTTQINKNVSIEFLIYKLQFEDLSKLRSTGGQPLVSQKPIYNLSFSIPTSLKEQTAIAQVLQAADKEIQLLKIKTEKLREQKKGMMQVLLTGKKRLNLNLQD